MSQKEPSPVARDEEEKEFNQIWQMFFEELPEICQTIETGINESDLRETVIGKLPSGKQYVLKIVDNDFTFPEKIEVWSRTAEEYQKLGYYAPTIYRDREGNFPRVSYKGRKCVAFAEDYAPYVPVEDRFLGKNEKATGDEPKKPIRKPYEVYQREMWQMTAKIAEKHFDYTEYPSAWCLFQRFCPSDEMDEITENAVEWKEYADSLPEKFHEQVERIWKRWNDNKDALEKVYHLLPTSIFQADLNATNLLLDEQDRFVGVFDFNLCGKEVCLNYFFREVHHPDFATEEKMLCDTLEIIREYYHFSEEEKDLALMLYRCVKPLFGNKIIRFRELKDDWTEVRRFLDETELFLMKDIDFRPYMTNGSDKVNKN